MGKVLSHGPKYISREPEADARFHQVLGQKLRISFNNLSNSANVPLGRFCQWLLQSGNLDKYVEKLASNFNPCAVEGLMCRTLVEATFSSSQYPSLETLVSEFLSQVSIEIDRASFVVAGPVVDGQARITNLPWNIEEARV